MNRFSNGILTGLGMVPAGLLAAYFAVAILWPDRLPAPAISRLAVVDEKFRWLRERPGLDPWVVAVGSSMAMRHLDGKTIDAAAGRQGAFFNGGVGFANIPQSRELARFYVRHFAGVETMLMLVGLPDFVGCKEEVQGLFDPEEAERYASGRWPSAYFYLRHFSPTRYLKAVLASPTGRIGPDANGSELRHIPPERMRGLRYGPLNLDPSCLEPLQAMGRELRDAGIVQKVVITPVNPGYWHAYPAMDEAARKLRSGVKAALAEAGAEILPVYKEGEFSAKDFYDAFHLQRDSAIRLTQRIAEHMGIGPRVGATARDGAGPEAVGIAGAGEIFGAGGTSAAISAVRQDQSAAAPGKARGSPSGQASAEPGDPRRRLPASVQSPLRSRRNANLPVHFRLTSSA